MWISSVPYYDIWLNYSTHVTFIWRSSLLKWERGNLIRMFLFYFIYIALTRYVRAIFRYGDRFTLFNSRDCPHHYIGSTLLYPRMFSWHLSFSGLSLTRSLAENLVICRHAKCSTKNKSFFKISITLYI